MENIRQAIERAKGAQEQRDSSRSDFLRPQLTQGLDPLPMNKQEGVELDPVFLQTRRLIAYDGQDPRSRSFDILRTQVLHSMDSKGWTILAVTSPMPGCGKTMTAINLALSAGRLPERRVLLVDLDLRRPRLASDLGLRMHDKGVLGMVEGQLVLASAVTQVRVGSSAFEVLPTCPTSHSSELIGSRAMSDMLQDLKQDGQSRTVILDLPPLLTSDDVIAILPKIDCVLLVAAVGSSTISEIKECSKHLQSTDLVRFVVNKVPEDPTNYKYY